MPDSERLTTVDADDAESADGGDSTVASSVFDSGELLGDEETEWDEDAFGVWDEGDVELGDAEASVFAETPPAAPLEGETYAPPIAVAQRPPDPRMLPRSERKRRVRLQARKVRRTVRHIEPWSVLKIAMLFALCLWVILVIAGFMLWSVADSSGSVGKAENLIIELFQLEEFSFQADQIFRGFALGGLVLAIAGTAFSVLLCVLFNLISDLTGGVRITVLEEETARYRPPRRRIRPAPQQQVR